MFAKCRLLIALLMLAVFPNQSAAVASNQADGEFYELRVEMKEGQKVIGTPQLTVKAGEEAFVSVAGENGYALRIVAVVARPNQNGDKRVEVNSEVYYPEGNGWRQIASPSMSMISGGVASIGVPISVATGSQVFEMTVSVKPVDSALIMQESVSLENCPAYKELGIIPLPGLAKAPANSYGTSAVSSQQRNCCSNGCLRCCGSSACCSDPRNCTSGCCT